MFKFGPSLLPVVLTAFISQYPMVAVAHLIWDPDSQTPPRNEQGGSCGEPTGNITRFKPGETITTTFNVLITHEPTVSIAFAEQNDEGFDETILATAVPAPYGLNTVTFTLPDIECDACSLKIYQVNYSSCTDIQLLSEGNHAPTVTLEVIQDGVEVERVAPEGGIVNVHATVIDRDNKSLDDPLAGLTLDWSASDSALIDLAAEDPLLLSFDPSELADGDYAVSLVVLDDGEPVMRGQADFLLQVSAPQIIQLGTANFGYLVVLLGGILIGCGVRCSIRIRA